MDIKTRHTVTRASVGILLVLAAVAPLFGDSPSGVVVPLLLAVTLAGADVAQGRKATAS